MSDLLAAIARVRRAMLCNGGVNRLSGDHRSICGWRLSLSIVRTKPRNQWHTFRNAGGTSARILEIISPAGFEKFFQELIDLGGAAKAPPQALAQLCSRYELDIDFDSIPGLVERFGVRFPAEPV